MPKFWVNFFNCIEVRIVKLRCLLKTLSVAVAGSGYNHFLTKTSIAFMGL